MHSCLACNFHCPTSSKSRLKHAVLLIHAPCCTALSLLAGRESPSDFTASACSKLQDLHLPHGLSTWLAQIDIVAQPCLQPQSWRKPTRHRRRPRFRSCPCSCPRGLLALVGSARARQQRRSIPQTHRCTLGRPWGGEQHGCHISACASGMGVHQSQGVIKRGHALVQSVKCISVNCSTRAYQTACTDSAGCAALNSSHHSS